jgi:DNA-binding NarL/FixJ family response regulator
MINIQIADDSKLFADVVKNVLNETETMQVTAVYYDLKSCYDGLKKEIPDILLLDDSMTFTDGDILFFCNGIKNEYPELKIIIFSSYSKYEQKLLYRLISGSIPKTLSIDELINIIKRVNRGELIYHKEVSKLPQTSIYLTRREVETLQCISSGLSIEEIAFKKRVSREAVYCCKKRLLTKLDVKSTRELLDKAREQNLI